MQVHLHNSVSLFAFECNFVHCFEERELLLNVQSLHDRVYLFRGQRALKLLAAQQLLLDLLP